MPQVAIKTATGVVAYTGRKQLVLELAVACKFAENTYLQHLDEGNAQVQICHVTADQTQTEHQTNGDNCAEVDTARHLDRLAAVENGGEAGQKLGHDGRKGQVPCCQNDGEAYRDRAQ